MSDVKRYEAVHLRYDDNNIRYGEGCEVEVVLASDYAALEAELAKLRAGQEPVAIVKGDGSLGARLPVGTKLYTAPQPSAVPEYTSAMGEAAQQYIDECCRGSDDQLLITPPSMPGTFFWYELYARMLAAAPSAPATVQGNAQCQLYTCIGKGGEYEYLGLSEGAGMWRGDQVQVYRCTATGRVFHRSCRDFKDRMEPIAASHQEK